MRTRKPAGPSTPCRPATRAGTCRRSRARRLTTPAGAASPDRSRRCGRDTSADADDVTTAVRQRDRTTEGDAMNANATSTLQHVTSKDGTKIAYDRLGNGPPVVLVCGGSVDRMSNAGLAAVLASDFSVINFDRRGRGDSGDKPPYAVEREIEDIDAVVDAAGGSACLYGTSSGAALALEAAARFGGRIARLALWEPPYILDPAARPPVASDQLKVYDELLSAGRRGDMAEYFMAK